MALTRQRRPSVPVCVVNDLGCKIPEEERDRNLFTSAWPREAAEALEGRWTRRGGHLSRRLHVYNEEEVPGTATPSQLWEALLRFPNAPLYGTHKKRVPPFVFTPETSWPNFHTMRVLGLGSTPPRQVRHVFLLHNGLNETEDLTFHYRLAAWILAHRADAVCILRPLPGHLTRFAFHGPYAEQPLDVYLRDPAELFRQFLRHMLETQWLLSVLVPRPHYAVMAGTRLLGEVRGRRTRPSGRADVDDLAKEMESEWDAAFESAEEAERKGLNPTLIHHKVRPTRAELRASIADLRRLLGWQPNMASRPPRASRHGAPSEAEAPTVHVVGYSMGGFMAQAAFFAWPFAISSCTNMFAGGALRDLAPTAFANPEEWQAVLHGMRYELDAAFGRNLKRAAGSDRHCGRIAGVCEDDFDYFTRIFYEVYLQYYRGGYESRVSEFSQRLLFVLGGDDPIVRTKNVLDAGPPQGMTLLQISDLSHFPASRGRGPDGGKVETEQRKYWLPEVGRMIANFSAHAESLLNDTLAACWNAAAVDGTGAEERPEAQEKLDREPVLLDSPRFARELRRLVRRIEPDGDGGRPGWLLVGRNEVPPVFMGPTGYFFHGQTVHHAEQQIAEYVRSLDERARHLDQRNDRATLLIPASGDRLFWNTKFFSMSETPNAARTPSEAEQLEMLAQFQRWVDCGMVREVNADEYEDPSALGALGEAVAKEIHTDRLSLTILPDIWIALSRTALGSVRGTGREPRTKIEGAIVDWATTLVDERTSGDHEQIERLQQWLDSGDVVAITVSAAELNPRYRGRRLRKARNVEAAIVHWALAYMASDVARRAPPKDTEQPRLEHLQRAAPAIA